MSGLLKRKLIYSFLSFTDGWNPSFIYIIGTSILICMLSYWIIIRKVDKPCFNTTYEVGMKYDVN